MAVMTQEELNEDANFYREEAKKMRNVKDIFRSMTRSDKDRAIKELWDKGIKIEDYPNNYEDFIMEKMDDLDFLDELERHIVSWEDMADNLEDSNPDNWRSGDELTFIPTSKPF